MDAEVLLALTDLDVDYAIVDGAVVSKSVMCDQGKTVLRGQGANAIRAKDSLNGRCFRAGLLLCLACLKLDTLLG